MCVCGPELDRLVSHYEALWQFIFGCDLEWDRQRNTRQEKKEEMRAIEDEQEEMHGAEQPARCSVPPGEQFIQHSSAHTW